MCGMIKKEQTSKASDHTGEVVPHAILNSLGESVGEPSKPSHLLTHGGVLSLMRWDIEKIGRETVS